MSVDLTQFHQAFFEESFEGLDIMESALMALDPNNIDGEAINTIFRSAHSLKGGGATFGFTSISGFTHVLETLLDQVRSGQRGMTAGHVDLLLKSVDCMREILTLNRAGEAGFTDHAANLKKQFEALLANENPANPEPESKPLAKPEANSDSPVNQWTISFFPGFDILKSGNDPVRIFSNLAKLGRCQASPNFRTLPKLHALEADQIYIGWTIELTTDATEDEIREPFEWVVDESEIILTRHEPTLINEWTITFVPNANIFCTGNEPLKILDELRRISISYEVTPIFVRLPKYSLMDPEQCYLGWTIKLSGELSRSAIQDVFAWVADDAVIEVVEGESIPATLFCPANPTDVVVPTANNSMQKISSQSVANSPAAATKSAESSSIRVGIDKIDSLINMVGELVITQSMLGQLGTDFDTSKMASLIEGLNQLEQNTRELQESVMRIRMLPISFAFSRFPRMVRDLGQQLGKKIQLEMLGENTELDKTVMEKIGDPLVHLVRNAIDHGIELPEERRAAGKSEEGLITLNAFHQGGNVVIEISDDGKGLDSAAIVKKAIEKGLISEADRNNLTQEAIFDLIFQPGFSTAQVVSDVSGRGVGMDVVRSNIKALNGVVELSSVKGLGSKICIRLPLTLAILDGQLVRVGNNIYIFPLVSIVESLQCPKSQINLIAGGANVFKLRDDYVPIVALDATFGIQADDSTTEKLLMVVVEADGEKVGIVVDELLAQQQVVIKSLEQNYRRVEGVSGATILGDGTVALILDLPSVVKMSGADKVSQSSYLAALLTPQLVTATQSSSALRARA